MYGEMAEFDLLTNGTKYKDQILQLFNAAKSVRPNWTDLLYVVVPILFRTLTDLPPVYVCNISFLTNLISSPPQTAKLCLVGFLSSLTDLPCLTLSRNYGYAAIRAYRAYNDPAFLSIAMTLWDFGNTMTLSKDQIDKGVTPVKDFNLTKQCQACMCPPLFCSTSARSFFRSDDGWWNFLGSSCCALGSAVVDDRFSKLDGQMPISSG